MRRYSFFVHTIPTLILLLLLAAVSTTAQEAESVDSPEETPVFVIPLREDVDRHLGVFLSRSLEQAEEAGARIVVIEIDTFGGRVDTALEIASRIGSAADIRTVAYVPADAVGRGVSWSAGALMAFSCNELWMAPGTSMGAAAPVFQTTEGMEMAPEKTVSAVRGQMAALAEKNGYPMGVALAMVDADVVLKEITIVGGEPELMTAADIAVLEGDGVEFDEGKTISPAGKLLTLTAGEMERFGVSEGTVATRAALVERLGGNPETTVVLEKSRADSAITFLTSAGVTSFLLLIGLVALYLEITSPGFGVPGTIALIAFALVFGGSALMGNLGSVELILFLLGTVLLLVEIFVIPGFGVTGISGIVLILVALIFSLQDFYWPDFDWQWTIVRRNFFIVGGGLLGAFALILVLMSLMPRSRILDRLILHNPGEDRPPGVRPFRRRRRTGTVDAAAGGDEEKTPATGPGLVGKTGITLTTLRPVGKARIEGRTVIVETEGEYIDKGSTVTVLSVEGFQTFVAEEVKS